ncbi:MAG: DUF853 family protein [Eubacteriales bacterium]|nr:DUF853 family protein [Eubacteriales bacterium]
MYKDNVLWLGVSKDDLQTRSCIIPKMANRHGLIAGATGTGKTVTLKVMAESFSACGVPVFLADVKGDLAGMCQPGIDSEDMQKRIQKFGLEGFEYQSYPTCFWDILQESGHPLRTTISEMGPMLLAQLLDLNQTQSDILSIVFRIADDNNMLLLDLKDLRLMLQHVAENAKDYSLQYGNISKQSVAAISRGLIALEEQGANLFFGEPAFDIHDWMRTDCNGKGYINILHAVKLIQSPKLYATFLLWMMSELFEELPEAGDAEKPRMIFFFDEAHILFDNANRNLLQKIEQVVKLIRSKGVGIYFITQSPTDIPNEVLAQLGNRVQHALRAYTPAEQKAVKAAAQSFRENEAFRVEDVITQLGIGEALVSCLDENGVPSIVQQCCVLPPQSKMGSIDEAVRQNALLADGLGGKYDTSVDRESAYEILMKRYDDAQEQVKKQEEEKRAEAERIDLAKKVEAERKEQERLAKEDTKARLAEERERIALEREQARLEREQAREKERLEKEKERLEREKKRNKSAFQKGVDSAMNQLGREVTRNLVRGLFNTLKKR